MSARIPHIHIAYNEGVSNLRVEVSNTSSFGRTRYIEDCAAGSWATAAKAGEIKVNNKLLEKDKLYYIRVQGKYSSSEGSKTTDWKVITAYYRGEGSGVEGVESDENGVYINKENILVFGDADAVEIYNAAGQLVDTVNVEGTSTLDINYLAKGAYIVKVVGAEKVVVLKYVK